jgi:hypothetical protein
VADSLLSTAAAIRMGLGEVPYQNGTLPVPGAQA